MSWGVQSKRSFPPAQLEPNRMVGVFINSSNRSARSKSENAHEVHGLTATLPLRCATAFHRPKDLFGQPFSLQEAHSFHQNPTPHSRAWDPGYLG